MRPASASPTLARHWIPGLFPFLIGDAIKLPAAAVIVPAGWRLRRAQ